MRPALTRRPAAALVLLLLALLLVPDPAGAAPGTDEPATDEPSSTTETDYGRMLLLLDSSGSMAEPAGGGATKMQAAQRALGDVVDNLPDDAYVGLRVYGSEVFSRDQRGACQDTRLVVPPGTDNRDELAAAIEDFEPYGETPIAYSLRQAAKDIGAEGTRSVVLVSDGVATCDPDPCVVAAELAEKGIDLQIDVVGLGVDGAARDQLRCIAERGNGSYYDADDAEDIVESLDVATSRALRPFALEGEPLAGGPADEPTPVTVGRWVDEIGASTAASERWFVFERTMPGSTLHVGASSLGSVRGGWDTFAVELSLEDGGFCGAGSGFKNIVSGELLGVATSAGGIESTGELDECALSDEVYIKVSRGTANVGEGRAPFSLTVMEEPAVYEAQVEALPAGIGLFDFPVEAPEASGRAVRLAGGSSFGEAPEIETGVYRSDALPGEAQAYRVRLEYGQSVTVRVRVPPAGPRLREVYGYQGPFGVIGLFNPVRGEVPVVGEGADSTGFATGLSSDLMTGATSPVLYNNRSTTNTAYLPGDYYIVYATDEVGDDEGPTPPMPFTLEVEVRGEPGEAPEYAGGQQIATGLTEDGLPLSATDVLDDGASDGASEGTSEGTDGATPSSEPSATDGDAADDEPVDDDTRAASGATGDDLARLGLVGGLVLVAVLCVGGAVRLLRR